MRRFKRQIVEFLLRETDLDAEDAAGLVSTPPDSTLGDYAVPCFRLAKALRRPPPEIAGTLAAAFTPTDLLDSAAAAGAYLNFRVNRRAFFEEVLESPAAPLADGEGETIVLDYGHPNIAKHLGFHHLRSSCIGFSLKRILTHLGYTTVGVNHLGDWGTTHGKLISAWKRWGEGLDLDEDGITKLNALYVRFNQEGDEDEGREWFRKLEAGDPDARALWERFREVSLAEFDEVFGLLGISFDQVRGESSFEPVLDETVRRVEEAGVTVVSDGALVVRFPGEEMPPLILRKSDGATTYATRDIAAALQRWEDFGFQRCIYVVDLGQSLHFKQLFSALEMMGLDWASRMEHAGFGLILMGGAKAATREGKVVLLRDVLEEAIARIRVLIDVKNPDLAGKDEVARAVGVGAIIFADISSRRVKNIEFDWEDMLNFEGHTGPYVQYTHARSASILRKGGGVPDAVDCGKLTQPDEWEVAKMISGFPERVRTAARDAEPSVVAQYLLELSEAFSRYYNLGNQDPEKKVLAPDPEVAAARLRLVAGVREVLARGLWLLGIDAPEEM